MEEKRTLIETFLPVEEISAEAKKEKLGRAKPPTSMLHFWWARKPLIAARSTVLGASLPGNFDISEFKRLLGLRDDQKKRAYNYDLSRNQLDKLKKEYYEVWGTETPTIIDPFAGGGAIPFESLRVGLNVFTNDYNPVAYLIQKATLEYPLLYGDKLFEDVEIALDRVFDILKKDLDVLYPKHNGKDVATYIYAWIASCPDCGFENPLVGQWLLSRKKNLYLEPKVVDGLLKLKIIEGKNIPPGTMSGGKGKCLNCGSTISNDYIKKEINQKSHEKLIAVVLAVKNGKEYDLPNDSDLKAIKDSEELLKNKWDLFLKKDLIPLEEMPISDVRSAKYLKYWYRILNPRQLLFFVRLTEIIREYGDYLKNKTEGNIEEEYVKAITTYLSFILAKHIDYNCRLASWNRPNQQISDAVRTRGITLMWDHTEVNPFVNTSGSLVGIKKGIKNSLRFSIEKLQNGKNIKIENKSIFDSELKSSIIVTDPPYFNDVQYAELSELFYIFEKRALSSYFVNLPEETPKSEDLSVSKKRSKEIFENLFNAACQKMNEMLFDDGILVMYFAHSSIGAWDFVVNALRAAKFRITATWPIHTEFSHSLITQGHASLMSSIIIVARKREDEKIGYIEEIKEELEPYLQTRLKEFWNYGLRGADITVSAMGATLDILTQYSEIKSVTGEMTVKDILELVEVYVVEYILEKFLKNSESLDSPTRFYTYCRLSQLDGMSFDTANLISKSLHIDLKSLESVGIINSITKGKNKGIKILKFDEREHIELKTLIDAVQLSMLAYEKNGMKEFEAVLADLPYTQGEIYNILESFKHLESGDSEKQIAMQILGKSEDLIPEKGQTTFE